MRRQAIIGALLVFGVGVVLGTTVFRADIAQATGLAQSITVNNTPAQAVPVREQNLDSSQNVKVHEQGTANVNVTNSSLTVATPPPISDGGNAIEWFCGNTVFPTGAVASALLVHMSPNTYGMIFYNADFTKRAAEFEGPMEAGNPDVQLAFSRPITFDKIVCVGSGDVSVSWVGAQP